MRRFDNGNRGGFNRGRDNFRGGRDNRFSRDRGERREMFDVTCTKCGKEAQVPFKPTGNKPVLCSDCFSKDGGDRRGSGGSSNNSEDLKQINAKLDKIIAILQELELDYDESPEAEESDDDEED